MKHCPSHRSAKSTTTTVQSAQTLPTPRHLRSSQRWSGGAPALRSGGLADSSVPRGSSSAVPWGLLRAATRTIVVANAMHSKQVRCRLRLLGKRSGSHVVKSSTYRAFTCPNTADAATGTSPPYPALAADSVTTVACTIGPPLTDPLAHGSTATTSRRCSSEPPPTCCCLSPPKPSGSAPSCCCGAINA